MMPDTVTSDHDPACCVLIPCHNEARTIAAVIESLLPLDLPLLVVDDGSHDGTADIAARYPLTLIRHVRQSGKGQALRSGFRLALERGFDGVLTMDGDGQHAAADIPRILAAARRYPGWIVHGARIRHRERQPAYRRRANVFADWGISWAAGQRLIDSQCGQRYYPRSVLDLAERAGGGFGFETAIVIEAALRQGVRMVAVPIEAHYPEDRRRSHFRPFRDFSRITALVSARILRGGLMPGHLRRIRGTQPLVFDPDDHAGPEAG